VPSIPGKQFTEKPAFFGFSVGLGIGFSGRLEFVVVLVEKQLDQHVAGLAAPARATGLGYLFYGTEVALTNVGFDGFIRDLETLANDFLVAGAL
jgi:hypothetical protein